MNTLKKPGRTRRAKSINADVEYHSDNATRSDAHPAINVKVPHSVFNNTATDGLDENEIAVIWDGMCESFWNQLAQDIAQDHGYSGVFSEGRSAGWLVPFFQYKDGKLQKFTQWPGQGPDYGYPSYPDISDKKQSRQFRAFRFDIEQLLANIPNVIREEVQQRLEDKKRIKCDQCEAAMINGVFCHETGCPNIRKKYIDGEWVGFHKCFYCGCEAQNDVPCGCCVETGMEPDPEEIDEDEN